MKTIAFDRTPGHPILQPLDIELIADSALQIPGRPVFIPDFTDAWSARIYVAFRISRLGKSIQPRFASRYYDAMALAMRLVPTDVSASGFLGLFDNALTLGPWQPLPAPDATLRFTTTDGLTATLPMADIAVDQAIASVSRIATVKNGDIFLPCHLPVSPAVKPDTAITITADATPWLDIRLK